MSVVSSKSTTLVFCVEPQVSISHPGFYLNKLGEKILWCFKYFSFINTSFSPKIYYCRKIHPYNSSKKGMLVWCLKQDKGAISNFQ